MKLLEHEMSQVRVRVMVTVLGWVLIRVTFRVMVKGRKRCQDQG